MSEPIDSEEGASLLPTGWQRVRLKYVAPISNEKLDGKPSDLPYIGLEHVSSETGVVTPDPSIEQVASIVSVFGIGDVLFGKLRPYLCKVVYADFDGVCTTELIVLKPNDIEGRYLFYQLLSPDFNQRVNALTYGAKMPRVGTEDFGNLPLVLPGSAEEQWAIADFLDTKTAHIDEVIALKEEQVRLLETKRRALISHAVTRGLDPDAPMKDSGVEWIGEIPAHWNTVAIKRTARNEYKSFTDGDWIESPYITDDGVRLIQTGNVGIGEYREQGFRYVSEDTFRNLNCTEVAPGDVLICRLDGPVGRACIAPELGSRMITSVDNAILKTSPNFANRFLVYFMSSDYYLSWIQALCRVGGGFRFRISRSMLGDVKIASPPFGEQRKIADYLDEETGVIDEAAGLIQAQIDTLRIYRQAVISAAVTGQFDIPAAS